ncbi:Anp1-domain-containing protein [Radiomyces spectabilis]|uniref:Anp1-domain-containing protein n=1 Tax=Radiomyces spectabilis TaxID=64574 RepID=UPI002220C867|nr:Anp1-domain-containing protein [Radiomyces spectabilis]KAI8376381.1 Anp1-domain-containing protein [Radiomyces spectabilis]
MVFNEKSGLYSPVRGNKRLAVTLLCVMSFIVFSLLTFSRTSVGLGSCGRTIRTINEAVAFSSSNPHYGNQATFINLNDLEATSNAKDNQEHVLILTPLKNAQAYLPRYFELVDRLSYPKHLISMAFLVSDTTDDTVPMLKEKAQELMNRDDPEQRYHQISIYEKDFSFELPEDKRHAFEMQPLRRSYMARSRNYLLTAALREEHAWVLWLDVDVVEYPASILEDLQSVDVDVVVPNCLLDTEDKSFWAYDKNNWQETERSLEMQKDLDPDYVLLEGYFEFLTNRYLMVDMPTHLGKMEKVPLDGVGATFTLVKAHVHREGANFPPYPFQHQVETEGFAKMAKAMGFGVYGLPGYLIYHIRNS